MKPIKTKEMFYDLEMGYSFFSAKDLSFILSCQQQFSKKGYISPFQGRILEKLRKKIFDRDKKLDLRYKY